MGEFETALGDLKAERPGWRLELIGMNETWFATLREPLGPEGELPRSFTGEQGVTPAEAVRSVLQWTHRREPITPRTGRYAEAS